ncbi:MAG: hypothetical protein C0594_05745 [Marinilabiliales bacterium]|nr:MAG: hypothetical protein C0594_05745 [Marinilabiliales bacterium]
MRQLPKILLIDDNETNVLLVTKILEHSDYIVKSVFHSREALEVLKNEEFDLVLLYIMMPEIDGFEVLDFIKKNLQLTLPVIMLTACHEKRYIDRALDMGADDYLKKPTRKKELLEAIHNALGETSGSESDTTKNKWFDKYFGSALRTFAKKKTVMIVDDNVSDVILLEHALEEKKYKVISSHDGGEALEMAINEKPDIILLDILLPGMDGIELLKRIKQEESLMATPVLMVSCIHEHNYIQKAMEYGIESYVTKPYRLNKLVSLIEEVVSESKEKPSKSIKFLT